MNSPDPDRSAQEVEEAYAQHGESLFRFALRLCGNRDDAEDVVVEAFAQAYRSWNAFRGNGSRRAWLYGIAVNRFRMGRRRDRNAPESLRDDTPQTGPDAMNGHGGANVTATNIVNGQVVDEAIAKKTLHDNGVDLSLHIDLDGDDYRSIAFGADHNHLVLAPKKAKDRRTVVTLDPKTRLPLAVAEQRSVGGAWKIVRNRAIRLGQNVAEAPSLP